ncbi:ferredoxin [Lentzea xinjiangensis]|uniref:ferredoxin n=1 Tax=Lentzea xinjiangensis TaxID=402600 RepID=UPI001C4324B8|nr:ferredoxin [Lentzea xinjiangensis]
MVKVDHDLCSGTGHCAEIAPKLFSMSDRRAWPEERTTEQAEDTELAHRAADGCPWFAISVSDSTDNEENQ